MEQRRRHRTRYALTALFLGLALTVFGGIYALSQSDFLVPQKHQITSVKVFEPLTNVADDGNLASDSETPLDDGIAPDDSDSTSNPEPSSLIAGNYYRAHLTETAQRTYDELINGFLEMSPSIDITDCAPDSVQNAYKYVLYDHPELFWVDDQYQYMITQDRSTVVSVQPVYLCSQSEMTADKDMVESQAQSIVDSIPPEAMSSNYAKAAYLFDAVCNMLTYDEGMADYQDIATVFEHKVTACGGYSKAYQYLCRLAGIECVYVVGDADVDGESILHAWNMLDLDGKIVYADVTWGDKDERLPIDRAWLGLTYDSISPSHHAQDEGIAIESHDPSYEVWAMSDAYYEFFDEQTVMAKMMESAANNDMSITMKFATPELLEQAKSSIKGTSWMATRLYEQFPDKFTHAFDRGIYSAYEIKDLNAIKVIWDY